MDFANVTTAPCLLPGSNTDDPCDDNLIPEVCEDPLYAYLHQSECPNWSDIADLVVRPEEDEVDAGKKVQFRAFLQFENGKESDVTALASWQTGNTGVATVNTTTDRGMVSGVAVGVTTVIATYLNRIGLGQVTVNTPCVDNGMDWVLVFDRSGSMAALGPDGKTRMLASLEAAKNLVYAADFTKDQMAVVSFAGGWTQHYNSPPDKFQVVTTHCSLTNDPTVILAAIDEINPTDWNACHQYNSSSGQWDELCMTGIGAGLEAAYNELSSVRHVEGHARAVALLSDGMENICLPDPEVMAEQMRNERIAIGVIALAVGAWPATTCEGVVTDALTYLQSLTSCDLFFTAPTANDLPPIYSKFPRIVCQAIENEDPCIYYGG